MPMNIPMAQPDVVASLVSYIAKPESYFITGTSLQYLDHGPRRNTLFSNRSNHFGQRRDALRLVDCCLRVKGSRYVG